ncbi:hypothetical protein PUV54_12790 [Hyphococcus flavus]|uniref:Uncharacterized protein n=1 Tax=Hyphococcus flavus TaxID=1866326 RepID=A0AAE9ZHA8_9PROT|nr:hypothetical protein [Hyphococcus flavus]WDI30831.1 hypothetical protein PUV54_12790 [Hyphococcus flavus]
MPFRGAHYAIAVFLVVTIAAFWPSYFSILDTAPRAHHIHGVTATLWVLLLIWQSWSIRQPNFALHKWGGRMSFLLAPPFVAGGLLVTKMTVIKDSPFTEMFAVSLSFADFVSVAVFVLFYFLALRNRHSVEHHSRYMLATIFPLIPPSVARIFTGYVPGVAIRAPEDLPNFEVALNISFVVAALFTIALIISDWRRKKPLAPFLMALGALVLMIGVYHSYGNTAHWEQTVLAYARFSDAVLILAGLVIGVAAGFLGWHFPRKPAGPAPASVAA